MSRNVRRLFLLLLTTLAIFSVSYVILTNVIQYNETALTDKKLEYENLSAKNEKLKEELTQAGTDEYIIRVARDDLGMIMPGEYRYIIADN